MRLSEDGKTLLRIDDADIQNGQFTIYDSVTHIGESAFLHCKGLTTLTIPNSVTHIGESAFSHCTGLTALTIPNSVTHIGESAFLHCIGLTALTISNAVTRIGKSTFFCCKGLTALTIPNDVTYIGDGAFAGCTGLTALTIPNVVTYIGDDAFSGCTGLTALTIPNVVTYIGERAFLECKGLTALTLPGSVTHIGEWAFLPCYNLSAILIDAENDLAYARVRDLLPLKQRQLVIPYELNKEIKEIKKQALLNLKAFDICVGLPDLPAAINNIIQQYDARLHHRINQVPFPQRHDELHAYKSALQRALSQFEQEQEQAFLNPRLLSVLQKFNATLKLQKAIDLMQEEIKNKQQILGFFSNPNNAALKTEREERIVVIGKLIRWLEGDNTLRFTQKDEALLKAPSVELILTNQSIMLADIPLTYSAQIAAAVSRGYHCLARFFTHKSSASSAANVDKENAPPKP